jgi:hypothetical protein
MRRAFPLALMLAGIALTASGCWPHDDIYHPTGGGGSYPYLNGSGRSAPPSTTPGYHVFANATTSIPGGKMGFLITANGTGGYRITWTDTLGSGAYFHGSAFSDTEFEQYSNYHGLQYLTPSGAGPRGLPNRLDFSSQAGSGVDGLDLVAATDPIYVDLLINGSSTGVQIYFTDAQTNQVSVATVNPVAFTSP